ncbi:MAG: pyridoxal-phosphate dependent enzyme [Candidatus Aquirickettsiella sp.]
MMNSILKSIGNTPLVKLEKIVANKGVSLLVKCEFTNPSGSIKDRIVDYIIAAETPNSFRLDQYDHPKNPEAHYVWCDV